jgi:NAD(P)-dependent dehydrogenase (short-subunit alcohol dehydrogenase family)
VKKNILIIGINGYLGSFLYKKFNSKNNVYGIDVEFKQKINNFYKLDISKKKEVNLFFKEIKNKKINFDSIINCSTISYYTKYLNRSELEIDETFNANLKGAINIILEYSKIHNKKKTCRIVNLSSIYGNKIPNFKIYSKGKFNSEIYGASKAGVNYITKYYGALFAKKNILINAISPGGIINNKKQSKSFINKYCKNVPLGRMAKLSDITSAICFLISDDNNYIIGQNIVIDGGLTL